MNFEETKVRVKNPTQSEKIQRRMFKLGFLWSGDNKKNVQLTDNKFLFFDKGKRISCADSEHTFSEHSYKEVTPKQILGKDSKPQKVTHIVTWEEEDKDPTRLFNYLKDAKEFIKEISDNSNVKNIRLIEVKSIKEVKINKRLSFKEFKL